MKIDKTKAFPTPFPPHQMAVTFKSRVAWFELLEGMGCLGGQRDIKFSIAKLKTQTSNKK
jgi:hypothetical protein